METVNGVSAAPRRVGGRIALDFANTVDLHTLDRPGERFGSYQEIAAWCLDGGILTETQARELCELALSTQDRAVAVVERARRLRDAIYRAVLALSSGESPATTDLGTINAELRDAMSAAWLKPAAHGTVWAWDRPGTTALESVLWPVVRDAAELLTSRDSKRVRQCDSEDCEWVFLDTSRNRSRRWCSMEDCGNRAKARRHYERQRTQAPSAP